MDGNSVDITKQNIERLKELFPEVLSDGEKIDFDMLRTVLGEVVEDHNERYQFTWHGKKQAILGTQKPSKGTLRPVTEKSKNFNTTQNLYIEGDNFEVLKLLQKSYNGKIKMIYLDPPYNTGKDFVYKDDFKDGVHNYLEQTGQIDSEGNYLSTNTESNGRFHTDWLNMMYVRLKLSRNLLTEDGVIFISIDDNELVNLRKICDEIFDEKNFIGIFSVNSTPNGRDYGHIAKTHEYIVFYGKNLLSTETNLILDKERKFTYFDQSGGFNIHPLYNSNEAFNNSNRPNLYYPFYVNPNNNLQDNFYEISLEKKDGYVEVYPPLSQKNKVQFVWRWGKTKSLENLNKEIVAYKINENEYRIVQKMRHNQKLIRSILSDTTYTSRRGTAEVENIFNKKIFDFPKPINLIKTLAMAGMKNDSIILDFFSGSATTAHATMELNAEDGGNRKFIMVQLPEPLDEKSEAYKDGYRTICDIGEERIRRAGEKIKQELMEKQKDAGMLDENTVDPESLDIGFKVLKLDKSNIREWNVDFENLENELDLYDTPFIEGRSELDVVYEIMLKYGLELTYPINTFEVDGKNVYDIAFGNLFICLAKNISTNIPKAIIAKRDEYGTETSSVVFSDAGFAGNDSEKLNCIELLKDAGYPEDNLLTI